MPDRKAIPLSQGGFFHRNQLGAGGRRDLAKRVNNIVNSPPAVIIKNKPAAAPASMMATKRHSAISNY